MEKRLFATILVCFVVVMFYTSVMSPPPKPKDPGAGERQGTPAASGSSETEVEEARRDDAAGSRPPADEGTTREPGPDDPPPAPEYPEQTFILKNPLLTAEVTSRGAMLASVRLHEYRENDTDELLVLFDAESGGEHALALELDGNPLDLKRRNWEVEEYVDGQEIVFRHPIPDGWIRKRLRLDPGSYLIDLEVELVGPWGSAEDVRYRVLGPERFRHEQNNRYPNQQVTAFANRRGELAQVDRRSAGAVAEGIYRNPPRALWTAATTSYFAFVIRPRVPDIPADPPWEAFVRGDPRSLPREVRLAYEEQNVQGARFQVGIERKIQPTGEALRHSYEIFLGPKDRQLLRSYRAVGYDRLIDYGRFLGPLVWLFMWLLGLFESIFRSYGIAIICLTILVKVILHPINKKNQAAMQRQQKKMAKIQPQMKAIREKHPNDPLKANREIQALMKENDINPTQLLGGCLLIFLQLPIWFGLFKTFSVTLDLRHASFLYVPDLVQPDRLFPLGFTLPLIGGEYFNLLPVLYVILTVVNQRMMPRAADPQMQSQQRIMTIMLVAFGFIFYNFASGLLLYFLTSSGLGIIEQRIIRAELKREEETRPGPVAVSGS